MKAKSRAVSVILTLIIGLGLVFFTAGCDDVEKAILDTEYHIAPGSYDGPPADYDADSDDWEWKVDPIPQGEYKYEWEIWSKSADGGSSVIHTYEGYSGSMIYRFTDPGDYEINVDIVNKSQDTVAEASAVVTTRDLILSASTDWIKPGEEITFTVNALNPPGDPVYEWKFGDGNGSQWETATTVKHVFENPGWYSVSVALRNQGSATGDNPGAGQSGQLAYAGTTIHVGHPATLIVPQPPLYAGVKYEFSLDYNGELPDVRTFWWEISSLGGYRTDANKFEWTFIEEGTYTVRGEVRHNVENKEGYTSDQIFAFGQQTITVEKAPELTIKVPAPPLQTGMELTFAAEHADPSKIPAEPYYEWDFGDGSGIGIPFSNEATHLFDKEGNYTVRVELFESEEEGAPLLGVATAQITVEAAANHLIELHQMNKFALDFAVQHDYVEGMSGRYSWDFESYGEVIWDGVNFSMQWEQYNHSEVMTGRVSEDGTVIEQLKIRHEFSDTEWYELEIQNLPFETGTMPDRFIVSVSNEDVQNYVVYFNTYRTVGYQWTKDASLYVRFTK